jgi:hypothetical protein
MSLECDGYSVRGVISVLKKLNKSKAEMTKKFITNLIVTATR